MHSLLYTYAFFVRPANQLCFGRLAYKGYLFGLDESFTEKAKRGFVFRMSRNVELHISFVFRVIALTSPHLLAVERVHRGVGVDRNRFQHNIPRRLYRFPDPPLNRLYLPGDAYMQRIEKTPERALRRQLRNFHDPDQERIPSNVAQLIEPGKANIHAQQDRQDELVRRHCLCGSLHRQSIFDQLLETDFLKHRGHRQEAAIGSQVLPGEVIRRGSSDFTWVRVNLIQGLFDAAFRAMLFSVRNHLGDLLGSKEKSSQTLFFHGVKTRLDFVSL